MSETDGPKDAEVPSTGAPASPAKRTRAKAGQRGILPVGFILNGIYEVKRFLARGGMGEVYEGVNVNADERVAIKVILPHLAADEKVQALFRKEAKTLTSLAHPALVQYRVLAREPRKDLLYIVTDFIDGEPLTNLIGRVVPNTYELVMLTRRLAEGLEAAHSHGAIHRDMSPDNVLLAGGFLNQAKIIDFGIAKSMEVGAQTVVGDGFAGKLGYVAPEQFGDFGRNIGPWTDVYSLALVVLGLAGGTAPDMGTTLVEAIDRRRSGPNLAALPPVLQPLFQRMLAADPAHRPQSMREIITALDALNVPYEPPSAAAEVHTKPAAPFTEEGRTVIGSALPPSSSSTPQAAQPTPSPTSGWGAIPVPPSIPPAAQDAPAAPRTAPPADRADITAAEVPATVFAPSMTTPPTPPPPLEPVEPTADATPPSPTLASQAQPTGAQTAPKPKVQPSKPVMTEASAPSQKKKSPLPLVIGGLAAVVIVGLAIALWPKPTPVTGGGIAEGAAVGPPTAVEMVVAKALPTIDCSWLVMSQTGGQGASVIKVSGVASDVAGANRAISSAAQASNGLEVDTADLVAAPAAACPLLKVVQSYRSPAATLTPGVVPQQLQFELNKGVQGCPAGLWTQSIVTVVPDPNKSFSLISVAPSGRLQQLAGSREEFQRLASQAPDKFKDLGGGRYRVATCQSEQGLGAMLLIEGQGPFDLGLRTGTAVRQPNGFIDRLSDRAKTGAWTMQMAWFNIANRQADQPSADVQIAQTAPSPALPAATNAASPAEAPIVVAEAPPPPPVPAPAAPPAPAPAVGVATPDWQPCRRFVNNAWEEMGYASPSVCAQRIFAGRCDVLVGRTGSTQLRRYNGNIQSRSSGSFARWNNMSKAEVCPG